jgi:hypothetical protein
MIPVIQPALTLPTLAIGRNYSYVIAASNNPTNFAISDISSGLTATISGNVVTFSSNALLLPASLGGSDDPTAYSFTITATNADGTSAPQVVNVSFAPLAYTTFGSSFQLWGAAIAGPGINNAYSYYIFNAGSVPLTGFVSDSEFDGYPLILLNTGSAYLRGQISQNAGLDNPGINWIDAPPAAGVASTSEQTPIPPTLYLYGTLAGKFSYPGAHNIGLAASLGATQGSAITPFAISVVGGGAMASGLPTGLSVNGSGQIVGTPTVAGVFFVTLSDTEGYKCYLVLTVAPEPVPVIASQGAVTMPLGVAANLQLSASNNPTSWAATGLPAGIAIDNDGLISGTPTTLGSYAVSVTASNYGGVSAPANFTISVTGIPPTVTIPPADFNGTVYSFGGLSGAEINIQCAASPAPTSWAATGLPGGFAISDAGLISGTSADPLTATISITATNAVGVSQAVTLILALAGKPVVSLPTGLLFGSGYAITVPAGSPVNIQCTATGAPTAWAAEGLPAGFAIDNNGLISGVVSAIAVSNVSITATNSVGTSNPAVSLVITVVAPPANYIPWVNYDPKLTDLQWDFRTGLVTSFAGGANGLYVKMGDDLNFAVVIKDAIFNTLIAQLNELELVISPDSDFDSYYAEVNNVVTVEPLGGGTYFALSFTLDETMCEGRLQQVFDALSKDTQGPNPTSRTVTGMCELRAVTIDNVQRRSRLFPITIEQNAST